MSNHQSGQTTSRLVYLACATDPDRLPPNGLALSCAAPIDRDDSRAEICFQNAHDLGAAKRRQLQRLVGRTAHRWHAFIDGLFIVIGHRFVHFGSCAPHWDAVAAEQNGRFSFRSLYLRRATVRHLQLMPALGYERRNYRLAPCSLRPGYTVPLELCSLRTRHAVPRNHRRVTV